MKDLIIIGAGPAGLSACLYATRAGAEVLMLDAGAPDHLAVNRHMVK